MTEKKVLPKMPWKWFLLGIAVMLISTAWQIGYMWDSPTAGGNYNRHENAPDDLYDDNLFISALMLFGLIPALTPYGRKIGPDKYALLYTFWHIGFSTAWTARVIPVYALSWYKDPGMSAVMLPSFFSIPQSEVNKFLVGGTPDINAIAPVLTWWTFASIMLAFTNYFIAIIFRRQLIEVERLPFPWQIPTVELIKAVTSPVSESSGRGGILKEKIIWYGFGVAWLIYIWDILRVVTLGAVPRLPLRWIQWGNVYADLTPSLVGAFPVAFNLPNFLFFLAFIPLDILLTIFVWFFGWFYVWAAIGQSIGIYPKVYDRGAGAVQGGIRQNWDWPKLIPLDMGVIIGIAFFFIWNSRDHLRNVLGALRGRKDLDDPGMSYKISVPGFIVCLLVFWGLWLYAGAFPGWSLLIIAWQIVAAIGLMRMRGEMWRGGNGLGWGNSVLGMWGWTMNSMGLFKDISVRQSQAMFVTVGMGQWATRDTDNWNDFCVKVPSASKVSAEVGGVDKHILTAILVGTAIGLPFTTMLRTAIGYAGRTVWYPGEQYWSSTGAYTGTWLGMAGNVAPFYVGGIVLGFVFMFLKARFAWWPLNPVGIAAVHPGWLSINYMVNIILAFACKYLAWKLGGAKVQRMIMLFVTGFLGGYFLQEAIRWSIGRFIIGPPNVPPP
ncbi:MAG: DUF6785 family protein [Nitrososphaerota archaeon]